MSSEFKVFTGLVLFVGILVIGIVAYDIYLHPPDPDPAGTVTVNVSGTPGIPFEGRIYIENDQHAIEAETPFTFRTGYRYADYIYADIIRDRDQAEPGTLKAAILVKNTAVDSGQAESPGGRVTLDWKAPRSPAADS